MIKERLIIYMENHSILIAHKVSSSVTIAKSFIKGEKLKRVNSNKTVNILD